MPPRPPPTSTRAAEKTVGATLVPSAERKHSVRQKVAPFSGSPLAGVNRRTTYDTDHCATFPNSPCSRGSLHQPLSLSGRGWWRRSHRRRRLTPARIGDHANDDIGQQRVDDDSQ